MHRLSSHRDRVGRRSLRGQGVIEYALLLFLVGAVVIAMLTMVGKATSSKLCSVANGLGNANCDTWSQASVAVGPGARFNSSMAVDPVNKQTLLFGGWAGGGQQGDTWLWSGSAWNQQTPVNSPSVRNGAAMAVDPISNRLLLFGGAAAASYNNDTWTWNGTNWVDLSPIGCTTACTAGGAPSPNGRAYGTMALDPVTNRLVLFGGFSGGWWNDTWTWTGTVWSEVSAPGGCNGACTVGGLASPSVRGYTSTATDPGSNRLLLFGGTNGGSNFNDTWIFTGSAWSQLAPATSPSVRSSYSLAVDPSSPRLVLFGGSGGGSLNDTWAWTGATWMQLTPATSPPVRYGASMAVDPVSNQLLLFSGFNGASYFNDTWTFHP